MKKNFKVVEDKNRIIDPWEDYINEDYENLSLLQKIIRPFSILLIIVIMFILIIGYLLVKTGQW